MGIKYNIISGVFAALAAVLTKVGFNFGAEGTISSVFMPVILKSTSHSFSGYDGYLKILLHVLFIGLMLFSNALMLRFYVKSMQENGAAIATVYNFAINYLSSIALGSFLF